jgi:hypothetical protein
MTGSIVTRESRSRWMDWKPDSQIPSEVTNCEPTKPSKPSCVGFVGDHSRHLQKIEAAVNPAADGSVGFVGSYSGHLQKIAAGSNLAAMARATEVLREAGLLTFEVGGLRFAGVWSDLDGPAVRAALQATGSGDLPVKYLDGPDAPFCFKSRRVPGESVPLGVLTAMERSTEPWKVRDRMLSGMGWKRARRG